jgi:hypothetical protein
MFHFPRHQDPKENWVHISPEFQTLMEECSFSRNQDINHNPRDVEDSNFSTCPSCTLCCLSLDLSISLEILEFQIWHPFEEAQN